MVQSEKKEVAKIPDAFWNKNEGSGGGLSGLEIEKSHYFDAYSNQMKENANTSTPADF